MNADMTFYAFKYFLNSDVNIVCVFCDIYFRWQTLDCLQEVVPNCFWNREAPGGMTHIALFN